MDAVDGVIRSGRPAIDAPGDAALRFAGRWSRDAWHCLVLLRAASGARWLDAVGARSASWPGAGQARVSILSRHTIAQR
jgi:hypothetical protein